MTVRSRSGNSGGRVPVFQTGWRGFDPHPLHRDVNASAVAQVAERRSRKAEVAGSWPACGS